MIRRFPDLTLAADDLVWWPSNIMRGLFSLPGAPAEVRA